jgi:hypothetical protein
MNTTTPTNARRIWSRILVIVGGIAMLVGAINPLGGALLILAGNGLVALGAFLGQSERRVLAWRVGVCLLIAVGVGATTALTSAGGFGGRSGRSEWWGMVALPILIGWSMGIWGPGSPRWLAALGIMVSLEYVLILGMMVRFWNRNPVTLSALPGIVLGVVGLLTIGGCLNRLRKRTSAQP